jgi:hypothetical protein
MSEDRVRYYAGATCPDCGSTDVVPIVYGLPGRQLCDAAQRGEVVLGGCCVSGADPAWICRLCGRRFGPQHISRRMGRR